MKTTFIRVIVVAFNNIADFYFCTVFFFFSFYINLGDFIFVPVFSLQKAPETKIQPELIFFQVSQLRQWSAPLRYQPSEESTKK